MDGQTVVRQSGQGDDRPLPQRSRDHRRAQRRHDRDHRAAGRRSPGPPPRREMGRADDRDQTHDQLIETVCQERRVADDERRQREREEPHDAEREEQRHRREDPRRPPAPRHRPRPHRGEIDRQDRREEALRCHLEVATRGDEDVAHAMDLHAERVRQHRRAGDRPTPARCSEPLTNAHGTVAAYASPSTTSGFVIRAIVPSVRLSFRSLRRIHHST